MKIYSLLRKWARGIMRKQEKRLTVVEANERIERGVNEIEAVINQFNHTPKKRDEGRRAALASVSMSLLAEKYGLAPPKHHDTSAFATATE